MPNDNDTPKAADGAVRAALEVHKLLSEIFGLTDPNEIETPARDKLRLHFRCAINPMSGIIDNTTRLSEKEATLKDCIEVIEDVEAGKCCWTQMGARLASKRTFEKVERRRQAALKAAREVVE